MKDDIPVHERKRIDVEPEDYDAQSFDLSKKTSKLLRRDMSHVRGEDGAVAFRSSALMFVVKFESSPYWPVQNWLDHLKKGGGYKKRFQYCVDSQ